MKRLKFGHEESIRLRDEGEKLYAVFKRLVTSKRYEAVIDRKVRTRCDECLEDFQVGDERVLVSSVVENKKKRKQRYHAKYLKAKISGLRASLKPCGYPV